MWSERGSREPRAHNVVKINHLQWPTRTRWGCFSHLMPLLLACLISLSIYTTNQQIAENQQQQQTIVAQANDSTQTQRQQFEARANEALALIRHWTVRLGRELHQGTQEATCHRTIRDQFDPAKSDTTRRGQYRASVVSSDWTRIHADIVKTISSTMGWHKQAVENIVRASESLASNHSFDEKLRVEYVDVHRLHDLDELAVDTQSDDDEPNATLNSDNSGQLVETASMHSNNDDDADSTTTTQVTLDPDDEERPLPSPAPLIMQQDSLAPRMVSDNDDTASEWQTPLKYLKLDKHSNFANSVPVNTEVSAVHVPVHIYPADPHVMNSIAWSEGLTQVFKNNFAHNPKLTNQYFASPLGFLRLYPAQKWQIARTDPDLYDARMRPWYVAGASSRKDVIILVDSSGSMTGSRRDIAKGVVFEILDTLTDNDHFLILKFSDFVQQVGVPACTQMRLENQLNNTTTTTKSGGHTNQVVPSSKIPLKNTLDLSLTSSLLHTTAQQATNKVNDDVHDNVVLSDRNSTDIDSLYLLPATGRNVRYIKTNFTIPTAGIANFSHALVTAFEVLRKYQDTDQFGSQCNQAIMLITDGSPSDFEDIFNRYNYPNAPVRVFTYLIGREANDGQQTKMMACHNRGFYTHVINLAEVRETVQQYIPVMARPLVLHQTHPTTWTPAYGELTYQQLTDWIWESRRREQARAILAQASNSASKRRTRQTTGSTLLENTYEESAPHDLDTNTINNQQQQQQQHDDDDALLERELKALDIFGYESNPDCFWELNDNDLLTTVVQPVYDLRNTTRIVEKFLNKNTWIKKESVVRTANLLGIAAADMKINDIIALAPSHKLGANGYAVMLTNNGLVMHHPDLRSVLEPFGGGGGDGANQIVDDEHNAKPLRILKPFFSSLDLVQVEHTFNVKEEEDEDDEAKDNNKQNNNHHHDDDVNELFLALRREAVEGKTGWRELTTKRTLDCQRRVQSRKQIFYYKALDNVPFSFILAIPQPYGSHRVEAQVDVKNAAISLPEKLTTYFTTSDYDLWTVHPKYQYCDGPSNQTITTLLDMFQRLEEGKSNDIQWRPAESAKPPVHSPDKIICDKQLVQSLVYDAVATFSFSDNCGPPSYSAESSLISMFGVRFSFVATRSGLTRARHYNSDDISVKKEVFAFVKRHARAIDETYYSRTVDYNMLINETATLVQVPFNTHQKIARILNQFELDNQMSGQQDELDLNEQETTGNRLSVGEMSLFEKLEILTNSSVHVIATQSIIVNEGTQRAVAGVTGVFYDYASFVLRLLNTTNSRFQEDASNGRERLKKPASCYLSSPNDPSCGAPTDIVKCGYSNDTIDCLLVDNNGYILVSENLDFVGRHLRAYDPIIMSRLVAARVYRELNITDYQSICLRQEEKQAASSAIRKSTLLLVNLTGSLSNLLLQNLLSIAQHLWFVLLTIVGLLVDIASAGHSHSTMMMSQQQQQQQQAAITLQTMLPLLPNKTYLRPCNRRLTRYERRPGVFELSAPEYYTTRCSECSAWFVYEQVPRTNLIMLIVDYSSHMCQQQQQHSSCAQALQSQNLAHNYDPATLDDSLNTEYNILGADEKQVCSMFEHESKLYKKKLDACYSHHPEEEHIKLCGAALHLVPPINKWLLAVALVLLTLVTSSSSSSSSWSSSYSSSRGGRRDAVMFS